MGKIIYKIESRFWVSAMTIAKHKLLKAILNKMLLLLTENKFELNILIVDQKMIFHHRVLINF